MAALGLHTGDTAVFTQYVMDECILTDPHTRTHNTRSQVLTPTQAQVHSHPLGFNPTAAGRPWHARPIPPDSPLPVHSLVIGSNLIPILPSQSQAPLSRQLAKCPHAREVIEPPTPRPPSTSAVEMQFTHLGIHTHTNHIFTKPHTTAYRHIQKNSSRGAQESQCR